jgi:hypothetical protein
MSPEQIDIVGATWQNAASDRRRLCEALADRLPGSERVREERAAWIIDAVSLLSPVIDRPTRFVASAGDLMARRGAVTISDLGVDQAALLGALDELLGARDESEQRAWALALKLFEETVASMCLDPFASPRRGSAP